VGAMGRRCDQDMPIEHNRGSAITGAGAKGELWEPRTAWPTKPLFDRRLKCVDERAEPSAMSRALYMTRWSEAKPR
jgi:hypothetical protein